MGEVKKVNIKKLTYYFHNDMINIKNFESDLLKIDRKSYKNIVFTTFDILQLKQLKTLKIFTL